MNLKKKSFSHGIIFMLSVLLILFSVQINYIPVKYKMYYYILYLFLFFLFLVIFLSSKKKISTLIIFFILFILLTLQSSPLKGVGLGIAIYIGYYAKVEFQSEYKIIMSWFFIFNFILVLLQFFGISETVYVLNQYEQQNAAKIIVGELNFGTPTFSPQFRPSGIFPSPTYISAYCVLFYSTIVFPLNNKNGLVSFLFGTFFLLTGSTIGLALGLCSIVFIFHYRGLRYFCVGYFFSLALLAEFTPLLFNYNFNVIEFLTSFISRLDINDIYSESVLQGKDPIILLILLFISIIILGIIVKFGNIFYLYPILTTLSFPVLVHDVTFSLFYFFMVSCVISTALNDEKVVV